MKIVPALISATLAVSVSAESSVRSFTPEELVSLAMSDNPELRFYEQQVSALPKPSAAKPPSIPQPLDFPYRESFRRAGAFPPNQDPTTKTLQPDKKVSIAFYDESMKPIAPGEQVVKVIAEVPSGKATLDFEKAGDAFVSTAALPEGDGYRIVVQIKQTGDAKPLNFRIDYHTEICGECKYPEYACVCESHLGYGFEESTPDHRRLSVIRQRLGPEIYQGVFEVVLAALKAHGLFRGRPLGMDRA